MKAFIKLFFLTTMTSELSKYINEQLDVFLNVETAEIKLVKIIKKRQRST